MKLKDFATHKTLRDATLEEWKACWEDAYRQGRMVGVIEVEGLACYVEGPAYGFKRYDARVDGRFDDQLFATKKEAEAALKGAFGEISAARISIVPVHCPR